MKTELIKVTAVDLMFLRAIFVLPMGSIDARRRLEETYKQAKEMEKEQIKDAYEQGDIQIVNGEQYYEQTYGGN
jgi:Tfp pilus assembly protein PilO